MKKDKPKVTNKKMVVVSIAFIVGLFTTLVPINTASGQNTSREDVGVQSVQHNIAYQIPHADCYGVSGTGVLYERNCYWQMWSPIGVVDLDSSGQPYSVIEVGMALQYNVLHQAYWEFFASAMASGTWHASFWTQSGYSPGTSHTFKIERNGSDSYKWDIYIDGTYKAAYDFGYGWQAEYPISELEANDFISGTYGAKVNYWTDLKYKRTSDSAWVAWDGCESWYGGDSYLFAGILDIFSDDYYYCYVVDNAHDKLWVFENTWATINGLSSYVIGTNWDTTLNYYTAPDYCEGYMAYWGVRVWRRDSSGNEVEITLGTPSGVVSQEVGNGPEYCIGYWTPPFARVQCQNGDSLHIKLYQKWDYENDWNDISDVGWQTYTMNIQAVEPSEWEIGYCLQSWTGGAGGIHSHSRFFFG